MKARALKRSAAKLSPGVETSEAILSGIADVDLFLARDIRKLLESGPAVPQANPTIQAYQPTRTSVTSA